MAEYWQRLGFSENQIQTETLPTNPFKCARSPGALPYFLIAAIAQFHAASRYLDMPAKKKSAKVHRCPTCRELVRVGDEDFPFCSDRCRKIDLGKWATGVYKISSPVLDPEVLEDLGGAGQGPSGGRAGGDRGDSNER